MEREEGRNKAGAGDEGYGRRQMRKQWAELQREALPLRKGSFRRTTTATDCTGGGLPIKGTPSPHLTLPHLTLPLMNTYSASMSSHEL